MTIVNTNLSSYAICDKDYLRTKGGYCLISYEPFWRTLRAKEMTTYTLITRHNISSATIDRMKKGKGITTTKLEDFCRILDCAVCDIIEYVPDKKGDPV